MPSSRGSSFLTRRPSWLLGVEEGLGGRPSLWEGWLKEEQVSAGGAEFTVGDAESRCREAWEEGRPSSRQTDGRASPHPEEDWRMLLESSFWGQWWRKTHGNMFLGLNTRLRAEPGRCEVPAAEHTLSKAPGGSPPDTASLSGGRRVGGPLPPPRTLLPALGAALSPADSARGKGEPAEALICFRAVGRCRRGG